MLKPLKSRILQGFVNAARSRGYELIPYWKMEAQPLARDLRKLFDIYQVDCVFDVGGNLGQFHDFIREDVGYGGTIITFEPVAKYIAHLQARAACEPNWQ